MHPLTTTLLCIFLAYTVAAPTGDIPAFRWSSIGLAVLTAFLQGMVTSLAYMTQDSNYWTFRFRLAKIEHIWWSIVTTLLLCSLVLIILSFLSGNNNDSLGVLGLPSASSLTIVQYLIPAWRSRHFIANRWLAWTGDSRTGIDAADAKLCGDANTWRRLLASIPRSKIESVPSDWYGWHILPAAGIPEDPTDILRQSKSLNPQRKTELESEVTDQTQGTFPPSIFQDGTPDPIRVSLLWGGTQSFRRRVSRATSSMPASLLTSKPTTQDGYPGEGLTLAMGILGRNKGLSPHKLLFHPPGTTLPPSFLETTSTWSPAKQNALTAWLHAGLEHQSLAVNFTLRTAPGVLPHELDANYRSSYVSMVISLNSPKHRPRRGWARPPGMVRPDLVCTGALLLVEGREKPAWWDRPEMRARRVVECERLEGAWRVAVLGLLGMDDAERRVQEVVFWCFDCGPSSPATESKESVG